MPTSKQSRVKRKSRDLRTQAASHQGLLNTQAAKGGICAGAGSAQIDATAAIAPQALRVVIGEAIHLGLLVVSLRLRLLHLQAQTVVIALKRPNALSQQGQVLALNRSLCVLVKQRLHFVEQGLKHYVCLHLLGKGHGSAGEGGAA